MNANLKGLRKADEQNKEAVIRHTLSLASLAISGVLIEILTELDILLKTFLFQVMLCGMI